MTQVCKTFIQRFESAPRLQPFQPNLPPNGDSGDSPGSVPVTVDHHQSSQIAIDGGPKVAQRSKEWGTGGVYKRGRTYWIHYPSHGSTIRESAKTKDLRQAELLLEDRIARRGKLDAHSIPIHNIAACQKLTKEATAANIGAIAEMIVAVDLMNRGNYVFRAINPNSPCDLVSIGRDGRVSRIEVKTGEVGHRGDVQQCPKIRNVGSFDVLAVVGRSGHIAYVETAPAEASDAS